MAPVGPTNLNSLPLELHLAICRYLSPKDLLNFGRVSKYFKSIAEDSTLWKRSIIECWGIAALDGVPNDKYKTVFARFFVDDKIFVKSLPHGEEFLSDLLLEDYPFSSESISKHCPTYFKKLAHEPHEQFLEVKDKFLQRPNLNYIIGAFVGLEQPGGETEMSVVMKNVRFAEIPIEVVAKVFLDSARNNHEFVMRAIIENARFAEIPRVVLKEALLELARKDRKFTMGEIIENASATGISIEDFKRLFSDALYALRIPMNEMDEIEHLGA